MTNNLDELKRELERLSAVHAQELRNVKEEQRELRDHEKLIEEVQAINLDLQSLFNKDLSQAMALSQSNTADLVLENVSKLEAKLEELDSVQSGQQVLDDLGKELQEILDVLTSVKDVERHEHVQNKIQALEKLAQERDAEWQQLKDEKEQICSDMLRSQKENRCIIKTLLDQYAPELSDE